MSLFSLYSRIRQNWSGSIIQCQCCRCRNASSYAATSCRSTSPTATTSCSSGRRSGCSPTTEYWILTASSTTITLTPAWHTPHTSTTVTTTPSFTRRRTSFISCFWTTIWWKQHYKWACIWTGSWECGRGSVFTSGI